MAVANSDGYGRRPGICDGVSGERIISKCLFRLPTDFGNQSPFYDVGQWKLATNQAHDVFASQSWNHLQNLITLKHIFFERRHPSSNSFWWRWTTSPGKCSSNFALTHSQRQTMSWQRIWASSPRCTSFCRVMMVLRACPWDRSYGHTWSCFLFEKKNYNRTNQLRQEQVQSFFFRVASFDTILAKSWLKAVVGSVGQAKHHMIHLWYWQSLTYWHSMVYSILSSGLAGIQHMHVNCLSTSPLWHVWSKPSKFRG